MAALVVTAERDKKEYLGSPYRIRIAVTSQRRVNLNGSVFMSITRFPAPILGRLEI